MAYVFDLLCVFCLGKDHAQIKLMIVVIVIVERRIIGVSVGEAWS